MTMLRTIPKSSLFVEVVDGELDKIPSEIHTGFW
jgi:hypothetical protein